MALASLSALGLGVTLAAFTLLWILSLRLRDASIADPFWGPAFVLLGATYLAGSGGGGPRGLLVVGLVSMWAARLGAHLLRRNRAHGEDPRYRAMRAKHGERFAWVSLGTVFWLQGALVWIVGLPLLAAMTPEGALGAIDLIGAALALGGLATEAMADAQLVRFRADPSNRGRVLDTGLWRYSRHPNYFGDAVFWWGLGLVALAAGRPWALTGPAVMTFLLVKVSGVALLERSLGASRPGYAEYARRTSAFIPWPPRS